VARDNDFVEKIGEMAGSFGRVAETYDRVLHGRGEAIPLPDASVDGVFVSTAWHWFDPALAIPEIARVLRDGGRLGVIWTSRDRADDWVAESVAPPATSGLHARCVGRRGRPCPQAGPLGRRA
jgi:SAM-dependent methyltransferase